MDLGFVSWLNRATGNYQVVTGTICYNVVVLPIGMRNRIITLVDFSWNKCYSHEYLMVMQNPMYCCSNECRFM